MKKIIYLISILMILLWLYSCLNTYVYPGKAEIVNREIDTSLNDSSLIYGHVYDSEGRYNVYGPFIIITHDSLFYTKADSINSYFELKMPAGLYTIICKQSVGQKDPVHQGVLHDLRLKPNEKVKIKFIYGTTVW